MLELIQVIIKRNILYENPNYIWLLALLSSSICAEYLHALLPQVVDYLYLTFSNSDGMTQISEVRYFFHKKKNEIFRILRITFLVFFILDYSIHTYTG